MERRRARRVATAFATAFLLVALAVVSGAARPFDEAALRALRRADDPAMPLGGPALREAVRDASALGGEPTLAAVTLVMAGGLLLRGRKREALAVALVPLFALAVSESLKALVARPRPSVVPGLAFVVTRSFPSGHSLLSAAVYLNLAGLLARGSPARAWTLFCFGTAAALTIAVGVSRVWLGVHYPSDVAAGLCLGAAVAALAFPLASDSA